jgi:hypothetical protein
VVKVYVKRAKEDKRVKYRCAYIDIEIYPFRVNRGRQESKVGVFLVLRSLE